MSACLVVTLYFKLRFFELPASPAPSRLPRLPRPGGLEGGEEGAGGHFPRPRPGYQQQVEQHLDIRAATEIPTHDSDTSNDRWKEGVVTEFPTWPSPTPALTQSGPAWLQTIGHNPSNLQQPLPSAVKLLNPRCSLQRTALHSPQCLALGPGRGRQESAAGGQTGHSSHHRILTNAASQAFPYCCHPAHESPAKFTCNFNTQHSDCFSCW